MAREIYDEALCKSAFEHIARKLTRPLIMRYFENRGYAVGDKSDRSLVTDADIEIEREIRAFLSDAFPEFGVIGEELGAAGSDREYVWTIDPIDGTEAFVAGLPLFGTLLSIVRQTESGKRVPLLGAIYLPVQDRLIVGDRRQTLIDGRSIRMRAAARPEEARLILGDLSHIARTSPLHAETALLRIARCYRSAHTWGDCLGYLHMLEGKAHARVEANLGVDDIAPLEPIFLGAAGVASTWNGTPFSGALSALRALDEPAATAELHANLLESLR
jgi:fructose-1,6-bisphosphatase/inositol monophosphatase family enzyme